MIRYLKLICILTVCTTFKVHGQYIERVKDLLPVSSNSPSNFEQCNGQLYFTLAKGAGQELWISDGTPSGTRKLNAGFGPNDFVQGITPCGGKVFFASDRKLYVTDGTDTGTHILARFKEYFRTLVAVDSQLFFLANDSTHGSEIWVSNGNIAGTRLVRDINPGVKAGGTTNMVAYDHKLFFQGQSTTDNKELWTSDGTASGTVLFKEINPVVGSNPDQFFVFKNKLYFRAIDTNGSYNAEPWVSDGTVAGTHLLIDLVAATGSWPSTYTDCGDKMFFSAFIGSIHSAAFISDGTDTGTHMLANLIYVAGGMCYFNNQCYFAGTTQTGPDSNNYELWTSKGADSNTYKLYELNEKESSMPVIMAYNGQLVITGADSARDGRIWLSDGTAGGTYKPALINVSDTGMVGVSSKLIPFNSALYFLASYDHSSYGLWKLSFTPLTVAPAKVNSELLLYPNPADQFLNIPSAKKVPVIIYNMAGQPVSSVTTDDSGKTDIAHLSPGIYLINFGKGRYGKFEKN